LSLNVIQEENRTAWEALRLLGWLGPDQITKKLLRSLLMARNDKAKEEAQAAARRVSERATLSRKLESGTVLPLVGGIALLSLAAIGHHALGNARKDRRVGTTAVVALSLSASAMFSRHYYKRRWESTSALGKVTAVGPPSLTRTTSISADVFEQTDQIWKIFKSFSLLVVKDGKGSIHRLLAQALRVSQNTQDARRNLEICLRAVLQAWTFKPEQVETWQDSINLLEHIKAVVLHSIDQRCELRPETAILSREAGVFIAMTLNDFGEAQLSLEQSLKILNVIGKINPTYSKAHAAALHELGRVFRYKGQFQKSEESLQRALEIRNRLAGEDLDARHGVASTLHELGVLEVKKHNLDLATTFLQQSLDLRHSLELEVPVNDIEADCASTLHQLAAVQVAHKPPSLDKAESLLKEALGLNMQIGQRAATLKQLARVAMRRGDFEIAERSLDQALELYVEMYGENTLHVNVAALKFQQGALAFQREQLEQAWLHFSECLRARRHVYAYSQGNHLEVSSVLHELGCVAFAQKRLTKACEMLTAEKAILVQLYETSSQRDRLFQARLTNLTWLRKCAKESGDNEEVRKKGAERTALKWEEKQQASKTPDKTYPQVLALQQEALHCRAVARQFALARVARPERKEPTQVQVKAALANLLNEIERSPVCPLRETAAHLHMIVTESLASSNKSSITRVFEACDSMRDVLRDHGMEVSDDSQRSKRL
jgi:tetratricopeptide (TPR) repeat protein